MSLRSWMLCLSLFVIGCGATDPAADEGRESCLGYEPSDPCITEENLQQCREAFADCGDAVQVLESCPLRFACP